MSASLPSETAQLFERCLQGDTLAETALFERYVVRLTLLARSRLSKRLAARVDPEDIVLSAYRSFFIGAREQRFDLQRSGDLWRLLVKIVLRKVCDQVEHHQAQRRSVDRELSVDPNGENEAPWLAAIARDPSPDEVVFAIDELQRLLAALPPLGAQVVELRLQGFQQDEIAQRLGCAERTVRRWLERARTLLQSDGAAIDMADEEPQAKSKRVVSRQLSTGKKSPRERPAFDDRAPLSSADYLVQRFIGAGALGRVYQARHHSLQRTVALKFLRKRFLGNPAAVERFLHEARMAGGLRHPAIVSIHGLGRTPGGSYFIAMDFIDGAPLQPVNPEDAGQLRSLLEALAQTADALATAHAAGIIHCDLKPANILRDQAGRVTLTDFGLARQLAQDDLPRGEGTPAWIAPEQVDACWGPLGPATDVFGLGATLYWLLVQQSPHQGTTAAEMLASAVSGRPAPPLDSWNANVHPELVALCTDCLAKPIDRRVASLQAVSARLQAIATRIADG